MQLAGKLLIFMLFSIIISIRAGWMRTETGRDCRRTRSRGQLAGDLSHVVKKQPVLTGLASGLDSCSLLAGHR